MKKFKVMLELWDNIHLLPLDKIDPKFIKKLIRCRDIEEALGIFSLKIKKIDVKELK
jgi:hypothetical protein